MPVKKEKKLPERRCIGCGESFPKNTLLRVVRDAEGKVSLDFTGKKAGRGAYICRNSSCFRKARKAKRFDSNLNCVIPEEILDALAGELLQNETK